MRVQFTRNLSIIKVSGTYPQEVDQAYSVLSQFRMVQPGSVWGLDGVAEYCADIHKSFTINKSGISKRQAAKYIKENHAEVID
jgi:hypothetical protein